MIELQEKYEKKSKIYTNDTINEMNSEVQKYIYLLQRIGIGAIFTLGITGLYFIPFFSSKDCNGCCCINCKNMTPIKRVILFYILFSPCIILSFF